MPLFPDLEIYGHGSKGGLDPNGSRLQAREPAGSQLRAAVQTPPGNSMRLGAQAGARGRPAAARGLSLIHFEDRNSRAPQSKRSTNPKHEVARPF